MFRWIFFTRERFNKLKEGNDFERWLYENSLYWFHREKNVFENEGIYIWDILSAAALLNPHLFIENTLDIAPPDEESMKKGMLFGKGKTRKVIIPKIRDVDEYIEHVYKQYRIFGEK